MHVHIHTHTHTHTHVEIPKEKTDKSLKQANTGQDHQAVCVCD